MLFLKQQFVKPLYLLLFLGLILILACGLIVQYPFRISWIETTRRKFLLYEGPVVELFEDKKLEQTFISNYPGLSQVDILLKGNNTTKVVFHLKSSCDSVDDIIVLSSELLSREELAFHSFIFPPLDDSAGKFYCLVLEAPEATPEKAILTQLSTGDLYPFGELEVHTPEQPEDSGDNPSSSPSVYDSLPYHIYLPIVNGFDEIGFGRDIGFQLHYQGLLRPTAQVFMTRLTANKPYILRQAWFYGGLVIVYAILLVGLFYVAQKTVQLERK